MNNRRIRIQVAVVAFILLPASIGVLAVHASPTCERLVRTYVTRPVRNQLTKATANAWAAWRIAHPNWKPNPNLQRPKYVMTREEAVQKVAFACSVTTEPSNLDLFFTPADLQPPPLANLPPMETQISFPADTPPEVAEVTPVLVLPVVPPNFPLVSGALVPEPSSLLMVLSGAGFLCLLLSAATRRTAAQSAKQFSSK